ncbi:MAG: AvaI/BsoBI family type II restriction endonuclease, partial [Nitrospinota bacterium]
MRNITGALAGIQFSNAILRELAESGISSNIRRSSNNPEKIQSIEWDNHFLLFDKTPKFIKKNIDVILLKSKMEHTSMKELLSVQKNYVALGELKGGIDPAGADEHWKTANSALERIRQSFKTQSPALFFVGAAIEADMAQEIFAQLKDGRLTSAANLTSHKQLADLATWLVHL